jgi:putative PIN family toxin of toxin-antitoxin system
MRIVCDTNVIVSGILFGGHSRAILTAVAQGRVEAFTTPALLNELREVLLRRKFRLTGEQVAAAMELVRESFTCVDSDMALFVIADDPDDDRVLEAALASGAGLIVSGDGHLLKLRAWRSITVLSPAEFVAAYLAR